MEKLTIAHLAPYLPYGLKMRFENTKGREITLTGLTNIDYIPIISNGENSMWINDSGFKPVLKPLSWLTKEIEHNGGRFVPSREINKMLNNGTYQSHFNNIIIDEGEFSIDFGDHAPGYSLMEANKVLQKLFEWRFDVFGLLDSGLAIEEGGQG